MSQTLASLSERLRDRPDAESWQRLVDLYTPLMHTWLRRYSMQRQDAEDVVQEVFIVVLRELPHFRHQGQTGAFRNWLRMVIVNRLRAFWRRQRHRPAATGASDAMATLNQLEDPASGLSELWNQEHDRHILARLLETIEPEFRPQTWQAFRNVVIDGQSPAEVAAQLQMSKNAVIVSKSRVLNRLRQEMRGLVE